METTNVIDKISHKADIFRVKAAMAYTGNGVDSVPYAESIVTNAKYPNFYFLVNENIIFRSQGIHDSEYQVFSFNNEGDYLRQEDVCDLGKEFFATMKIVKVLAGKEK